MGVKQKRFFTLIEVLVALVLTTLILSTLMFFYRQVIEISLEIDRISSKNFDLRYLETRLADILPKAIGEKEKDFVFFSLGDEGLTKPGSDSLIFTFNHDASLNKDLSQNTLARIYLEKNGKLMIAYWPSPSRWDKGSMPSIKKEFLFQDVEKLAFEFYIAPPVKENDPKQGEQQANEQEKIAAEPEPKGGWRKEVWLEEYKQLPVMVKLILTMSKKEKATEPEILTFIYPLVHNKSHVTYE